MNPSLQPIPSKGPRFTRDPPGSSLQWRCHVKFHIAVELCNDAVGSITARLSQGYQWENWEDLSIFMNKPVTILGIINQR